MHLRRVRPDNQADQGQFLHQRHVRIAIPDDRDLLRQLVVGVALVIARAEGKILRRCRVPRMIAAAVATRRRLPGRERTHRRRRARDGLPHHPGLKLIGADVAVEGGRIGRRGAHPAQRQGEAALIGRQQAGADGDRACADLPPGAVIGAIVRGRQRLERRRRGAGRHSQQAHSGFAVVKRQRDRRRRGVLPGDNIAGADADAGAQAQAVRDHAGRTGSHRDLVDGRAVGQQRVRLHITG